MGRLGGQSAFVSAVTTASAATARASFAPESSAQRAIFPTGSSFAEEFEGYTTSRDQWVPRGPGSQERAPGRSSATPAKPQKENKTGQSVPISIPIVPIPAPATALPIDLYPGVHGNQDDALTASAASCDPQAVVGGGPLQPMTMPQPDLTAADSQATAFMMRMQVMAAAGGSALQAGTNPAASDKQAGEADNQETPSLPQLLADTQSALPAFGLGRQAEFGVEVKQAPAPSQAPELRAIRADDPPQAPKPLNNILLQVNKSADEKVIVRLVQQSGELRLAVRTDDSELAHGLQDGLPELVGKLQGSGYRADTWHPVQSSVAAGPTLENPGTSNHSRQGDPQSQSGGSQQNDGRQQQNKHNQPRWAEEMEFSLTGKETASGESYGFTR